MLSRPIRALLLATITSSPSFAQAPNVPLVVASTQASVVTGAFASTTVDYDVGGGGTMGVSRATVYGQFDWELDSSLSGFAQTGLIMSSSAEELDADGDGHTLSAGVKKVLLDDEKKQILGIASLRRTRETLRGSKSYTVPPAYPDISPKTVTNDYKADLSSTVGDLQVFSVFRSQSSFEPYAGACIALVDSGTLRYEGTGSVDVAQKQKLTIRGGGRVKAGTGTLIPELSLLGEQGFSLKFATQL